VVIGLFRRFAGPSVTTLRQKPKDMFKSTVSS
jgi:hypothetical protein